MKPFKVGDRVSWAGKKGLVVKINTDPDDAPYSVAVNWDDGFNDSFTNDGRFREDHKKPSLKHLVKKKKPSQSENDSRKLETVPVDCKKWNGMSGDLGRMVYCINFLLACERKRRGK